MKAIRVHQFGEPEVMRVEDVPEPAPGANEIVVQVHAVGVNPVDTYIRSGAYTKKPALPYTPGMDGAGTVQATGSSVKTFKAGDRVYLAGTLNGAYAEFALCSEAQVHTLPLDVSFAEGAGIGVPYGTAYRALHTFAQARHEETVLVHGASGGVGIAAVQLARAFGMKVIGTGGTQKGRALVFAQGADHALDHTAAGYLEQIQELTDGREVNIILEMLANVNLGNDLKLLAKGGRVVVIGSRGAVEINPRDLIGRDASILGMALMNATPEKLISIHQAMVSGFADRTLRPIINTEMPLTDAALAHRKVLESGAYGKIVLLP